MRTKPFINEEYIEDYIQDEIFRASDIYMYGWRDALIGKKNYQRRKGTKKQKYISKGKKLPF